MPWNSTKAPMPLFDARARKTDGMTARRAARMVKGEGAASLVDLILDALKRYGPMTSDETAEKIGRPYPSVAPRFAPLERDGYIAKTGQERKSLTSEATRYVYQVTGKELP